MLISKYVKEEATAPLHTHSKNCETNPISGRRSSAHILSEVNWILKEDFNDVFIRHVL